MSFPKSKLLPTIVLFIVALGLGWWFMLRRDSQRVILPDGATLTLAQIDYGKTDYEFHYGGLVDRILHTLTPQSWITEMRTNPVATVSSFKRKIVMRAQRDSERTVAPTNSLVLWFDRGSTNSSLNLRVLAEDEDGVAWDTNTRLNTLGNTWTTRSMTPWGRPRGALPNPRYFQIAAFPRRKEFVRLNIVSIEGSETKTIGQFRIRNPAYADYPVWQPHELPSTVHYEGYEFTLADLSNIRRVPSGAEPEYSQLTAKILVTRQGVPSDGWNVGSFEIEDATGNVWSAPFSSIGKETNAWILRASHVVPTNEVFKFRATIWRLENFSPEELWEIPDVPLPEEGHFTTVTNASTSRDGFTLKFLGISERNVKFPGALSWGSSRSAHFEISPPFSPAAGFWRLSVVDILTEKGTSITGYKYPWLTVLGPKPQIPLAYSTNSDRARFIFALAKPHKIDFLVRAKNGLSTNKH